MPKHFSVPDVIIQNPTTESHRKMKLRHLFFILALTVTIGLMESCSKSPVNEVVTAIDNYTLSVDNCTNMEELLELDAEFSQRMQPFTSSDYKLTDSEREAIIAASSRLGRAVNDKIQNLQGVAAEFDIDQREAEFADAINQSETLGEAVSIGL